ncbi:hypothetical protein SDC9_199565 [bioreactor metagenome]|uniref:Uncharacterized protein n=1 Tax=bioreactor metagenome TaxID=1076179 RepID=A0A645IU49_9ZZZZ
MIRIRIRIGHHNRFNAAITRNRNIFLQTIEDQRFFRLQTMHVNNHVRTDADFVPQPFGDLPGYARRFRMVPQTIHIVQRSGIVASLFPRTIIVPELRIIIIVDFA